MKQTGKMLIEYLRSVHKCLSMGEEISASDLGNIQAVIDRAEEVFK